MAGRAKRLGPLPCSKEVHPVRSVVPDVDDKEQPTVICEHLLWKMRAADIKLAYIVLRKGKWDIPAYLGDGKDSGLHLAYLMMGLPYGTPYSLDQAYPFIEQAIVALGFPDMMFGPENIFASLLDYRRQNEVDVVLGLFPADRPQKVDMVDVDSDGRIREIYVKPKQTVLHYTWGVAVWTPVFTRFMHEFLASRQVSAEREPELFVGDVVRAAIGQGLSVYGVSVSEQPYVDIGTRDDLQKVAPTL